MFEHQYKRCGEVIKSLS